MNAASGSDEPQKIWDAHTMNAPWGLAKRLTTAVQAVQFFNPNRYAESCKLIDKIPDQQQALSLLEFVKYLEKTEALGDRKPNLLRVVEVLNAMSREGILQNVGSYAGKPNFFHDCFLFMYAGSQNRNRVMGQLWLAAALGPEFIYYAIGHGVVQITGKNDEGDDAAGTGTILSEHTISCLSMKVRSPMPCSCSCLSPTRSQRRRRELHGADSDMAQRLETAMAHTLRLGSLAELHG